MNAAADATKGCMKNACAELGMSPIARLKDLLHLFISEIRVIRD
jgi:hypothetical protein